MLVLCYGIPKSGSTLAFELVRGVLKSAGFEQPTFVNDARGLEGVDANLPGLRNFVIPFDRQRAENLIATIGPDRRIAVKTHAPFPDADYAWLNEQQANGAIQIVASYRDPREICLSLVDAAKKAKKRGFDAFGDVEHMQRAQKNVRNRIPDFRKWASLKGSLRLDYDTIAFAPDKALRRIEDALHVTCIGKEDVKDHVYYEAPTQKNKAVRNRYKDELSDAENAQMLEEFDEFIHRVCEQNDQSWFDECRAEMLTGTATESTRC